LNKVKEQIHNQVEEENHKQQLEKTSRQNAWVGGVEEELVIIRDNFDICEECSVIPSSPLL
jgi:hypothetical protein